MTGNREAAYTAIVVGDVACPVMRGRVPEPEPSGVWVAFEDGRLTLTVCHADGNVLSAALTLAQLNDLAGSMAAAVQMTPPASATPATIQ